MSNTKNKSIIFAKKPEDYPVAGEHFLLQHTEDTQDLNEGDFLRRNLYLSLDPCKILISTNAPAFLPSMQSSLGLASDSFVV